MAKAKKFGQGEKLQIAPLDSFFLFIETEFVHGGVSIP